MIINLQVQLKNPLKNRLILENVGIFCLHAGQTISNKIPEAHFNFFLWVDVSKKYCDHDPQKYFWYFWKAPGVQVGCFRQSSKS